MRFTPERNIKASGQKKVRVRASFGREVKKMFLFRSLLAGCFSIFFFFSADVSRIRRAHRMVDIPQNLANIIPV